ncbi:hypothetical protein VKT23_011715 [Stygiomarasmius scandens]|uniref:F-box domain-containing protein n=1 Tax=Marasmiellus scandens TaxID=2682957 RepID=A0ABR1JAH4_9AGAR
MSSPAGPGVLPQELFDAVIDHCADDTQSLKACSLVCHNWLHQCRVHLFQHFCLRFKQESAMESSSQYTLRLKDEFSEISGIINYIRSLKFDFRGVVRSESEVNVWVDVIPRFSLTQLVSLEIVRPRDLDLFDDSSVDYQNIMERLISFLCANSHLQNLAFSHLAMSERFMNRIFLCIARPESMIKELSIHSTQYLRSARRAVSASGDVSPILPLESLYFQNETPLTLLELAKTCSNFSLPKLTLLSVVGMSNVSCTMAILDQAAQTLTHVILDMRWFAWHTTEIDFPITPNLTHLHLMNRYQNRFFGHILQKILQSQAKMQHIHIADDFWLEYSATDNSLVRFVKDMPSLRAITVCWGTNTGFPASRLLDMLPGTNATGILEVALAPQW